MPNVPIDIIQTQNEMRNHQHTFTLWPQRWETCSETYDWQITKLSCKDRGIVPNSSGIYTLLAVPNIAGHPACSYLMYVGQSKSLRRRFREYLSQERTESGRPKIFRFLNMYSDQVWFCFTLVHQSHLDAVENGLRDAYVPPLNDNYSGELSKVVGAFR